jgi:hypothetical protein
MALMTLMMTTGSMSSNVLGNDLTTTQKEHMGAVCWFYTRSLYSSADPLEVEVHWQVTYAARWVHLIDVAACRLHFTAVRQWNGMLPRHTMSVGFVPPVALCHHHSGELVEGFVSAS